MTEQIAITLTDAEWVESILKLADLALKLIIALIGFYLAHSLSRHISLRVSEKRLNAYASLWAITGRASPARLHKDGAGPLTIEERIALHEDLAAWYYMHGNGMLLADSTRTMFLKIKDNLTFPIEKVKPDRFRKELEECDEKCREALRGTRLISQLSLLRTRMKADMGVFGIHYGVGLKGIDKAFLVDCGERLWRRPWRKPIMQYIKDSYNKRMQTDRPTAGR